MGIIESCKQHVICCNKEGKIQETETDEYSESISYTNNQNSENEDGLGNYPSDLINMKVKANDLVLEHQTSPYLYYKELLTLGSGTYGTVKKVCLINNPSTIRAMKIIPKENFMEDIDNSKLIDVNLLPLLFDAVYNNIFSSFISPCKTFLECKYATAFNI